jgi:hypothetical protein
VQWFKSVNWALIRNQTPPYIPPEEDLSKLKPSRLKDDVSDAEWTTEAETEDEDSPFAEFNPRKEKEKTTRRVRA